MSSTFIKRNSKEWKRMWFELAKRDPNCDSKAVHNDESWQYMGTTDGEHQFRHRSHPTLGRAYINIQAIKAE